MTKIDPADREEIDRQYAFELDRMLAMTLVGVSIRRLVLEVIAMGVAAAGLYATMLYVAQRLYG